MKENLKIPEGYSAAILHTRTDKQFGRYLTIFPKDPALILTPVI